jgi:hypothetical protein
MTQIHAAAEVAAFHSAMAADRKVRMVQFDEVDDRSHTVAAG